ncbi:anti-sigma factor family protein [Streptomyces griseoviridis]
MTYTEDMTGHPDIDELSDLTEGLLTPSRTAEVRRHLDGCEPCADVRASLEEIRSLLGTVQEEPVAMPDDVADRIDAALATEALLDAVAPTDSPAPGMTDESGPDGGGGAHVSRETSPAATASAASTPAPAAAAARPAGRARTSTTGPGRKDRRPGGRRRVAVLGTVFTVAALGIGSVLLTNLHDDKPTTRSQAQETSKDTFSQAKLESQVSALLQDRPASTASEAPRSMGIEGSSNQPKVFKEPTVPACVREGIGRTEPALAAQTGTYQGTGALLVVLPDVSDGTKVTAYLVDASCVTHPSSTRAKVLLTRTYTHP